MTDALPLDLAADLVETLNPDGEAVNPEWEMSLPGWDEEDPEPEAVAAPRRRWRVDSDERADYALRRVELADEEAERIRAHAAEQIAQITAWAGKMTKAQEDTRAFFLGSAIDYARRRRMADDSFRTLPLPCGWRLTAHDGRAGVDKVDEEAFCAWALANEHDDVVKVTTSAKLREVAKRYAVSADGTRFVDKETSELVPGIVPRPAGWKPDAKPAKAAATPTDDDQEDGDTAEV